jgi:hypothetical protein
LRFKGKRWNVGFLNEMAIRHRILTFICHLP